MIHNMELYQVFYITAKAGSLSRLLMNYLLHNQQLRIRLNN